MLPNIADIAVEHGLEINPRSINQTEVYCKCPFCLEDSNKPKKYYLAINTQSNVYRCWFCGVKGGVLDFEARLTGLSYDEIKEKRLGKLRKPLHAAERLSPNQLDSIGWKAVKQKDKTTFKKSQEQVLKDWQEYEFTELVGLYAELKAISQLPNQERQHELGENLKAQCQKSKVSNCYKRLLEEYEKPLERQREWAYEGDRLFQMAWLACTLECDNEFEKLVVNVPFFHFMWKAERKAKQTT